jgi:ABC-type lipoprotein release transport system permease subunit
MRYFLEIAGTGLVAVIRSPLRSLVILGCLVSVLLPFLTGLGLSKGIQQQAEASVRFGADLYVTGTRIGRSVPVSVQAIKKIQQIEGVADVVPRIVGGIVLGTNRENAVVVGIPFEKFPPSITCVEGSLSNGSNMNELVVGTELARRLHLTVGTLIPPFYHSSQGERVSKVVGIFKSEVSIWQSNLIFTSFDTASSIFNQQGMATDLLVYCRPGYAPAVGAAIRRSLVLPSQEKEEGLRFEVTTREDLAKLLPSGILHREGIFNLHFVLAFALGIPLVLVASGLGLSERRREIGILKATGWQTDEILLRGAVENFILGLSGASVAILLAYIWLSWLNGWWIASIFLAGVDMTPSFKVPFRLTPVPALLSFLISFVVVMSGTLYTSWRAATVPPMEAMR